MPTAITEIEKGCTFEIINASIAEEMDREEVVVEIAAVLDSVLTSPLGDILSNETTYSGSGTSDEPPLQIVYEAIAEELEVQVSDEGFSNFTEAITQITEAKKAACEGNISDADIPQLGIEYNALKYNIEANIKQIRDIFGKMLCFSEKEHDQKRRRRDFHCPDFGAECSCPSMGDLICVCEFFACLDPADDITAIFGLIDVNVPEGLPCLAFAVDTTASMGDEIEAVKVVVRNVLASEEDGPRCYVLQPFNDLTDGSFHPDSKLKLYKLYYTCHNTCSTQVSLQLLLQLLTMDSHLSMSLNTFSVKLRT